MLEMRVVECLRRSIITVEKGMSIRDAARVMKNCGISGVLVMEGSKPVGVLSDTDLVKALYRGLGKDARVEEVMSRKFFCVDPSATLMEAARIMTECGVSRLFVVRGARGETEVREMPEGIISVSDIMAAVAGDSCEGC